MRRVPVGKKLFVSKHGDDVLRMVLAIAAIAIATFNGRTGTGFALVPKRLVSQAKLSTSWKYDSRPPSSITAANDFDDDVHRLIALRSHSLDELVALANELEVKWQRLDWNQYARVMIYVCSEIANRGLKVSRVREQTEHFARVAISHSKMFDWEYQSSLVGWFSYQRQSSSDAAWLRERKEKAQLWLETWRRLENEIDPTFDINDPKNRPTSRVLPPDPRLPPGTPPSAIKDQKLRAQYTAAIADNQKKSERMLKQYPLQIQGPTFKSRAERVLIQLYSQQPARISELKQYLQMYMKDSAARARILDAVAQNAK